jgi:hypothetical protein
MFERNQDLFSALYIIVVFIAFTSGFFLGALFSPARERKEYEPWHALLAAAEKPRHGGKVRSTILPAVVIALVVVSGLIVLDHFKGPPAKADGIVPSTAMPRTR